MTPTQVYELLGVKLRSNIPIVPSETGGSDADVDVHLGPPLELSSGPPAGTVIAENEFDGRLLYTGVRTDDGYTLRCYDVCDFAISRDLRFIHCTPQTGADHEFISVLLSGTVIAFMLTLDKVCVLHASAIARDDTAVAVVGSSGMGKSTVAALACAAGASLLADDVLRVDVGDDVLCTGGAQELRLRPPMEDVVSCFDREPPTRRTAGGRLALRPPLRTSGPVRLGAIVIPLPSSEEPALRVEQIPAAAVVTSLARHPRIQGWRDRAVIESSFRHVAGLSRRIPAFEARIPYGPPFDKRLGEAVLQAVSAGVAT